MNLICSTIWDWNGVHLLGAFSEASFRSKWPLLPRPACVKTTQNGGMPLHSLNAFVRWVWEEILNQVTSCEEAFNTAVFYLCASIHKGPRHIKQVRVLRVKGSVSCFFFKIVLKPSIATCTAADKILLDTGWSNWWQLLLKVRAVVEKNNLSLIILIACDGLFSQ